MTGLILYIFIIQPVPVRADDGMTPSRMVLAAADTLASGPPAAGSGTFLSGSATESKQPFFKPGAPSTTMYHSLYVSGWGQMDNGRKKKAALCIAAELFCIGGFLYENHLLGEPGRSSFDRELIRTDRNTFVLYWLGVKLFSMVDAYVDAQLRGYDIRDVTPPGLKKTTSEP